MTGITYIPRAVVAADFTPAVEIENEIKGGADVPEPLAALNNTALATLRVEAKKDRNKEVRQLRLNSPKFFDFFISILFCLNSQSCKCSIVQCS